MLGFLQSRVRRLFWTLFYRSFGRVAFKSLGDGAVFEGWVDIPQRGGSIVIGPRVLLCRLVEFSVPPGGQLIIEEGAFIGRGVVVSAHCRVTIGKDTMIAEFVSIHDNDHKVSNPDRPIAEQGFLSQPLEIGRNCWIGAKAVLVRRSGMGDRCVLGAGAVLTKPLPPDSMAAGVPAQIMKQRDVRSTDACLS